MKDEGSKKSGRRETAGNKVTTNRLVGTQATQQGTALINYEPR
jgi:hypothetical protein